MCQRHVLCQMEVPAVSAGPPGANSSAREWIRQMDFGASEERLLLIPFAPGRGKARELTAEMGRKIEGWLKGIVVLSAFVGVGTTVGMWALGMPYPLLLGVTAGLAELVPLAGPYLASAPGILVALFQPTWKLIAVVLFFVALQMVENQILAPAVLGRHVEMPPLLVILALLLGASLMGIVGAILALPVAAIILVLWTDLVVPAIKRQYHETHEG